ncbi:MAG: trypsin-like peptidase domain-containing protein [Deltaproteobacteria bacterium]|nr:trypsin-like peptidase domain-containing protein [Deltaproteobacteria bacterium]
MFCFNKIKENNGTKKPAPHWYSIGTVFYRYIRSLSFLCLFCLIFSSESRGKIFTSFAHIAKQAIPGVVNIRTKVYVRKDPALDLYEFFLDGRIPQGSSTTSLGSGVIISQDGYIVTNYHVIKDASKIEVLFAHNKKITEAKVIGIDRKTDLSLLKVSLKTKLTPLTLGDSNRLEIGDIVLAIGNPFGYSHTVTSGIISAKGRVIGTGPYDNFLQTDATIHPGNSGGPLLDLRGRVIAINTAVSSQGSGIGFAIPSNMVSSVIQDLKQFGKVRRPWLGIVGKNILSEQDIEHKVDSGGVYGVIISNLIIDSPAHKAQLRIGDLIMSLNGKKIFDLNELQRYLVALRPGQTAMLRLYRRGKGFMQTSMQLEETPRSQDLPQDVDLF